VEGSCNDVCDYGFVLPRNGPAGTGQFLRVVTPEKLLTVTKAPMFGDYIQAFNSDLTNVVQFTGVAILVLGFSNFIWYVGEPQKKGSC
jgi:hypothetical protein